MKSLLTALIAFILLSCSKKNESSFYMPAEWEPHDAVWIGWEDESIEYHPMIIELVKTICPNVTVKVAASSDSLLNVAKRILFKHHIDSAKVKFYVMPGDRYWIRDHGAAFLVNTAGDLGVADFDWNNYGYPYWLQTKFENNADSVEKRMKVLRKFMKETGAVDSLMAVAENAVTRKVRVKHEGGAIEVNGNGTLILCEATVFQRNPGISKDTIESEFKRGLGVTNIIWMKEGLADDPLHFFRRITGNYIGGGTGGHTDEFVRFANENTILLAWVDEDEKDLNPINRMNYDRMNVNYKILSEARDVNGNPFEIVKVPLPDLITKRVVARNYQKSEVTHDVKPDAFVSTEAPSLGDTLLRVPAASYLNYLVTNGIVVLPSYTEHGSSLEKEEKVNAIFQKYFPGRKIKFIQAMAQNWDGGGIHCSTQQQPSRRNR